jgi:Cu+-exporting ATPase
MPAEQTTDKTHAPNKPVAGGRSVTELSVTGMTCSNCVRHVTGAIQSVPGVHSAAVSLEDHRASVRWAAGATPDVPAVIHSIEEEGYGAKELTSHTADHGGAGHTLAGWTVNLWIGVLGTLPLMIGDWVLGLGLTPWFQWLSLVLAGIVQVFAGAQFYRGAWSQLKAGNSNMDTLVALGSTTAFGYSVWALLSGHGGHVYFMEAAAIITLISLGHWLESRVSTRASGALRELLNLAPPTARRLVPKSSGETSSSVLSPAPALTRPEATLSRPLRRRDSAVIPMGEGRSDGRLDRVASVEETEVRVAELMIGDLVVLRPGDRVPTDGEVIEGDSAVDESMLTGESVPVDKTVHSRLYAGTANVNGRLLMRVTATGEETALARIIAAVQRAQTSRANIQRLGDRVSSVFVPIVVIIAVVSGVWWGLAPGQAQQVTGWLGHYLWPAHPPAGTLAASFLTAAAVLIVACPCAMGLATPVAIMAGSNAAARLGILIRDGVALEKAGKITGVIFDKTGTLTVGKAAVVQIQTLEGNAPSLPRNSGHLEGNAPSLPKNSGHLEGNAPSLPKDLGNQQSGSLQNSGNRPSGSIEELAAALARHSTHPISQAIAKTSSGKAESREWQELPGAGVQARCRMATGEWRMARLGSLKWLRDSGVDFAEGEPFITAWAAQGATLAGLAVDHSLLGLFAVKDTLKPAAPGVVQQLHRQGLKTYLVTGDNALTAAAIAKQAGIRPEHVHAEVRPEQKAEFVKQLQRQGERVAFVGDGINDAPALEQADLGIAVSRASDIAREAADIILLNSEIEAVPESLGLARATLKTIKQNLFWAFFYNSVGVPLAALGFMSPILCAAAMGFSDLLVIGNALRLRNWRLRAAPQPER